MHTGFWAFGNKIVYIFGPVYMLKSGVSLPIVALIWGFSYTARFILRPLSMLLVKKIGLKKALIIGTVVYGGIFPIIYQVRGVGWWMWFLVIYLAVSDILYFLPYHSLYAGIGDLERRGQQLASRAIASLLFATAAPIVGAILAAAFGFKATYLAGVLSLLAAAVPLIFIDDFRGNVEMGFREAYRSIDFRGFWTMLGDAVKVQMETFVWVVSVFFLSADLVNFGWLIGLQTFLTTLLLLILGRLIDGGKAKKIFLVGSLGMALLYVSRAFLVSNITGVLLAQIALAVILVFWETPFDTVLYNMAKQTKSTLWFHFFGEAGADVGNGIMFYLTALLVYAGFKIQHLLVLGVLAAVITKPLLDSYFKSQGSNP